jgi:hypothetical protein
MMGQQELRFRRAQWGETEGKERGDLKEHDHTARRGERIYRVQPNRRAVSEDGMAVVARS